MFALLGAKPADETNSTVAPTASPSYSPSSGVPTISPNDTPAPTTESPTITAMPTEFERERWATERRNMTNPSMHFCGTLWQQAKDSCNNDPNAIPCPSIEGRMLPCPSGELCFAIGGICTPPTLIPTSTPSESPTTAAPTTPKPSSSPVGLDDESNWLFCGKDEADASSDCDNPRKVWCRYGSHADCPTGQACYDTREGNNGECSSTHLGLIYDYDLPKPTVSPTMHPTISMKPTEDLNPQDYYCSETFRMPDYDEECGVPCPSMHSSECPGGQICNGPLRKCVKTHKVGAPLSWCGADAEDAASGCHQACPEGADDECPDGMTCWATRGQCTMLDSYLDVIEERKKFLWCGSSYRHLVENCAEACPSGSNDECGVDDDGNEMTCWDMSEEEMYCNTTGLGIVEPTDPDMLWCGNSWNEVLEECPKKCPTGSDEECGFFWCLF